MKCSKCKTENIAIANYCKNCGNQFTTQEKEKAQKSSTVEILKKAEDIKGKADKAKDILSLSFITDNLYVRIALIIIPFITGMIFGGGDNSMKIRKSNRYNVYYNTATEEYFLEVEDNNIDLLLYVPKDTDTISVSFNQSGDYSWQAGTYTVKDTIRIEARQDGYYTVEASGKSGIQSIVLYTVKGGAD